jgi:hypothetical protein
MWTDWILRHRRLVMLGAVAAATLTRWSSP